MTWIAGECFPISGYYASLGLESGIYLGNPDPEQMRSIYGFQIKLYGETMG